jgi:hypothetical protein
MEKHFKKKTYRLGKCYEVGTFGDWMSLGEVRE